MKLPDLTPAELAILVAALFVVRWIVRIVIWRVKVARFALRRQAEEDALVAALRGDAPAPEAD